MHKTRNLGSTVYFWFAANDTSGSGADGETPQCDVRLAGDEADAAPVLSPTPTLLTHANYGAGLHEVAIAATAENGFAAGNEYAVFCTLLVDSQNPAGFLGSFYLTAADQAPLTVDDIQNGLATAGGGARTMVFTLSDGAGRLAGNLKVQVEDGDGNLVAGPLWTTSLGVVTFYLDDGDYTVVSASTVVWQGNSEEVTVSAATAATGVAITLTAQTLPMPSAPDKYVIIINCADEFAALVGSGAWSIKVTRVWPRGLAADNLVQLTEQNPITVDGNGQASFEIAKTTTAFTLEVTPTLADATAGAPEYITVEVDAAQANDDDQIYLSDLMDD